MKYNMPVMIPITPLPSTADSMPSSATTISTTATPIPGANDASIVPSIHAFQSLIAAFNSSKYLPIMSLFPSDSFNP